MEHTMFKSLRTLALSALLGGGTVAASMPAAQADGLYLGIGSHGNVHASVFVNSDGYYGDGGFYEVRDHRRRDRDRRHWQRRHERQCSPREALAKARDIGLRRAEVRDVGRNTIQVRGRMRGDRVTMVFARQGNCRVLSWR